MVDLTDEQFDAATMRGRIVGSTRPRAAAARYDRHQDRVIVDLVNGSIFAFPPRLLQGFEDATADQIAEVEVLGMGVGLHWESLDADFTIEGLMAGRFGTRQYMEQRFGPDWRVADAA